MAKVTSERFALQSLLTRALGDLETHAWVVGLADMVVSEERADVAMRETIERERQASTAVRELRGLQKKDRAQHGEQVGLHLQLSGVALPS